MICSIEIRSTSGCAENDAFCSTWLESAMKRSVSPENSDGNLPVKRVANIVRLNVGGRVFDTFPQTLSISPYFDSWGRMAHTRDESGRVFIDRDGDLFAYLLNFMRTTKLYLPQSIILEKRQQLLGECDYFGMDWLAQRIRGEVSCFDQAPADKLIRESELAGEACLLDVFATDMSLRDPIELQCQSLPPCTTDRPSLTGCFGDFVRRFDDLIGGWLHAGVGHRRPEFRRGVCHRDSGWQRRGRYRHLPDN